MNKPKVAIACQGGGSQTAFTAGVLRTLFENNIQEQVDIVSLTGTSGGAICAFLIWYAIKKGHNPVWQSLIDFWEDNTAQSYAEQFFNDTTIKTIEWTSKGLIPQYSVSPASPLTQAWLQLSTIGLRPRFTDLKKLLKYHINFDELNDWGIQPNPPILLIGACNILSGKPRIFNSYHETILIEHLLASACVPNIFPTVSIEEMAYWDGLFSENPPIDVLIRRDYVGLENLPDEIWVIKINPTTRDTIPTQPDDIADRKNELEGNISLLHGLNKIEYFNYLFLQGAFKEEFLAEVSITEPIKIPKVFADDPEKPYHIPLIRMSEDLAKSLNYESKLDRSPANIKRLIEDGEKQGNKFLQDRLAYLQK